MPRGRAPKYPWIDWFDAGRTVLRRGVDFEVSALSMQKQAQTEGRKQGIKVRTKVKTDEAGVEWLLIDTREEPVPRKRHDWDALFARAGKVKQVVLEHGKDFDPPPDTMRVMVLQAAKRRDLAVKTKVIDRKYLTVSLEPVA